MTKKKKIAKAKLLRKQFEKNYKDRRAQDTLGFLVAKGLLFVPKFKPNHQVKLKVKDALWAAKHVEPRVLEVLPAAIIHYPSAFLDLENLPKEIQEIIEAIQKGKDLELDCQGIRYAKMKHWANFELPDRRTKPVDKKKVLKSFRLSKKALFNLTELARANGKSESASIEALLESLR